MKILINTPSRSSQYFAMAKRWSANLSFHQMEAVFLHRLLDDYFLKLSEPQYIEQVTEIKGKICSINEQCRKTVDLLSIQVGMLNLLTNNVFAVDSQILEAKQLRLEYWMTDLDSSFRQVKKLLFGLIEEVVQNDDEDQVLKQCSSHDTT